MPARLQFCYNPVSIKSHAERNPADESLPFASIERQNGQSCGPNGTLFEHR